MKLYISGGMTGIPQHNFPAFNAAEALLKKAGFEVENPAKNGIVPGWAWEDYLRLDLKLMLDCDAVATLDGWIDSRGAWLEVSTARALGMSVRSVAEWAVRLDEPSAA